MRSAARKPNGRTAKTSTWRAALRGSPASQSERSRATMSTKNRMPCTLPAMRTASGRSRPYFSGMATRTRASKLAPSARLQRRRLSSARIRRSPSEKSSPRWFGHHEHDGQAERNGGEGQGDAVFSALGGGKHQRRMRGQGQTESPEHPKFRQAHPDHRGERIAEAPDEQEGRGRHAVDQERLPFRVPSHERSTQPANVDQDREELGNLQERVQGHGALPCRFAGPAPR